MKQRLEPRKQKSKKDIALDEGFDDNKYFGFDLTTLRQEKENAFFRYMVMNIVDPPVGTI